MYNPVQSITEEDCGYYNVYYNLYYRLGGTT